MRASRRAPVVMRMSSATPFESAGSLWFRLRWYGSAALVSAVRVLRLRPEDLDTLFPWALCSIVINGVVWLLLLGSLPGMLPKKPAVDSLVEISLTPYPTRPRISAPAVPAPSSPKGAIPASPPVMPQTASPAAARAAFNAYLKDWESQIMALAEKHLFHGNHPALPPGRVVVAVTIAPDGQLMTLEMLQGSRNSVLVNAVETVIRAATPFPALPAIWQSPPTPLRIVRTWSFQ